MSNDYSTMRHGVSEKVPTFFQLEYRIKATATMKKGALKALDAIEKLFGPQGKHWVKGHWHSLEQGFDAFCLSGAFNKIDGKHEALARAAVAIAIVNLYPRKVYVNLDDPADVGAESTIVAFNDHDRTKFSDVKAVLKYARKLLR